MQSLHRFGVTIVLLASVVSCSYNSNTKLRRDGVLNLYPFPRVGRANHRTWQVPTDYYDMELLKRQLYAFPRVGKSEPYPIPHLMSYPLEDMLRKSYSKRVAPDAESGMWFGARLGRSTFEDDISEKEIEKSQPEEADSTQSDRK